jgi:hypothetical protein
MDDDTQTPTNCEEKPEEERQNRRQFFNGLGKWSLARSRRSSFADLPPRPVEIAKPGRPQAGLGWRVTATAPKNGRFLAKAHELQNSQPTWRSLFHADAANLPIREDAMKIDETKCPATDATCEGDRQNRREFFNGLGKWSMIVVAAVSFPRVSAIDSEASHEDAPKPELGPQRPAWTASDDRSPGVKVARRPQPYGRHTKYVKGHLKYPEHTNKNVIQ